MRLRPLAAGKYPIADNEVFSRIVAAAFAQRRKKVQNALKQHVTVEELALAGIEPSLRPEALGVAEFVALANIAAKKSKAAAT